jgi:MEMO1 family protein
MAAIHVSPYSGTWYPGSGEALTRLLEEIERASSRRTGGYLLPDPIAFVVPHAGLEYSGTVAGAVYRCLRQARPERIILLGFCHRSELPSVAIPEIAAYTSPSGQVTVDRDTVDWLLRFPQFVCAPERVLCDHSVEIQLPFLQWAAPNAAVVPLYVGELSTDTRNSAAEVLAELARPGTVILASSDFTHYGRDFGFLPFAPDCYTESRLRELDLAAAESAGSLDETFFLEELERSGATVCGREPIALLLATLRRIGGTEIFQEVLDYQTSGEITGGFESSVSYCGLGYFPSSSFGLSPEAQDLLLGSARATLETLFAIGKREAVPPVCDLPELGRSAEIFVTLRQGGRLCGCLGTRPKRPLREAVPEMTLCAALDDCRFQRPSPGEGEVSVEISILTPWKRVRDPAPFRPGEHGAALESGCFSAVLLPQVARDRHWDAAQFFNGLCAKAGVSPSALCDPLTKLYVFRAQVFGDRVVF